MITIKSTLTLPKNKLQIPNLGRVLDRTAQRIGQVMREAAETEYELKKKNIGRKKEESVMSTMYYSPTPFTGTRMSILLIAGNNNVNYVGAIEEGHLVFNQYGGPFPTESPTFVEGKWFMHKGAEVGMEFAPALLYSEIGKEISYNLKGK